MALPPRAGMSEPVQIYEDNFFNQPTPMISHAPMPSIAKPPQRRLLQSAASNNAQSNAPATAANSGHKNPNGNKGVKIEPPLQPAPAKSPSKIASSVLATSSPRSPLRPSQGAKLNMVSFQPPYEASKPTDSLPKKQPLLSRFQTVAQKPLTDLAMSSYMSKDSIHPVLFPAPPGLNLSIESYYQKGPGKRLLDAAPIKDCRPVKRARIDDDAPLPPHDSFPSIVDDGLKPSYSYAMLIGMAILRSPGRKLTLSQIYKWISDTFAFYNPQDAGWQNSIRHNLSLNKAFVKQERPKEAPGKGHYWAIDAGMEHIFLKDKAMRKPMGVGDNIQLLSSGGLLEPSLPPMPMSTSFSEPILPQQLPSMPLSMVEPSSSALTTIDTDAAAHASTKQQCQDPQQQQQQPHQQNQQNQQNQLNQQIQQIQQIQQNRQLNLQSQHQHSQHNLHIVHNQHNQQMQQKQKQQQTEPSSDATIIVSDAAGPDDQLSLLLGANDKNTSTGADQTTDRIGLDSGLYSPVLAATALHSSPPITRHIESSSGTPPPMQRPALLSSVNNRTRKRKSASLDDSGYISSLESSALRSNQNVGRRPPSEGGDRSRIKRGRAEEEIARLRASSYDSPTKGRSRNGYHPASSSPLRNNHVESTLSGQMAPPPLTPAVKLKASLKPPPSVSPNTNLRMHRDKVQHMLASPLRRIAASASDDDATAWPSPTAFDESLYTFTDDNDFLDTPHLDGSAFEIFQDDALHNFFPSLHTGSPVKAPSSKRLRLERTHSATTLADVTNSASRRNVTSAPFLKVPTQSPGLSLDTPSKLFENLLSSPSKFLMQSPSKPQPSIEGLVSGLDGGNGGSDENAWVPLDDFCTPELLQDVDDFGGMDILQGFEKIGSNFHSQQLFTAPPQPRLLPHQQNHQSQQGTSRKISQKPVLGRSYTSTF